jgi:riboflavin synthase
MFTGIIEERGKVKAVRKGVKSSAFMISAETVLKDIAIGDSINTNGVCLTVTAFDGDCFSVDVMPETMRGTNLGTLKAESEVNLERALQLSGRLGGHLVSGHIDGTGVISSIKKEDNAVWYTVAAGNEILRYLIPKGSVALDGISLTVVHVGLASFDVSVIPHTHSATTISGKKSGDIVNIECDQVGKYIEKFTGTQNRGNKIDKDFLDKYGF